VGWRSIGISTSAPGEPAHIEPIVGPTHAPPDTNAWRNGYLDTNGNVIHGGAGGFGIGRRWRRRDGVAATPATGGMIDYERDHRTRQQQFDHRPRARFP
jgi:hypothetical protein